ncbi:MAG TPA: DnaJ family domain-containing protein [Candidatus Limnocylindrales bacterium]
MPQPERRPASRLDAEGNRQVAPTWESLVERQLREAMAEGKFDELPHQGERLPLVDDTAAGDWAMAYRMLRNAGAAPPWIEADKEVRRLLERRDAFFSRASRSHAPSRRDRAGLVRLVAEINAAIASLNAEAPTDRQHRRPLVLADELARLDALAGR